jgi:hypothetical protein
MGSLAQKMAGAALAMPQSATITMNSATPPNVRLKRNRTRPAICPRMNPEVLILFQPNHEQHRVAAMIPSRFVDDFCVHSQFW